MLQMQWKLFFFLKLPFNSNVIVPAHTMLHGQLQKSKFESIPIDVNHSHMIEIEELKKSTLKNVSALMVTQLNGIVADMDPIKSFVKK